MKNWKDTLSTVCGLIAAIAGAIVVASQSGLTLPAWLISVCGALSTICLALIAWMQGKNPNLSVKTPEQVDKANTGG